MFDLFGVPLATVMVSVLSLTGYLAATFILPEVYGHVEQESAAVPAELREHA